MNYLRVTSGMKHISLSDFPRTNTGMPYNLRYYVFVITFDLDIWDILWSQAFFFFSSTFCPTDIQQAFLEFLLFVKHGCWCWEFLRKNQDVPAHLGLIVQ